MLIKTTNKFKILRFTIEIQFEMSAKHNILTILGRRSSSIIENIDKIMSGFESLSKPLKPRSEVAVHTLHPTLEQKPRAKYSVPDWFNHKYYCYCNSL